MCFLATCAVISTRRAMPHALVAAIRYRVCFAVTGVIYAVALAALVPLIWLVPQEKDTIGGKPEAPTVHAASETDSEDPASS